MRKNDRHGADHLESHYLQKVANAVPKSALISHGFTPDGDEQIFVNGKVVEAVTTSIDAIGMGETWKFLAKDLMIARDAKSDRTIRGR